MKHMASVGGANRMIQTWLSWCRAKFRLSAVEYMGRGA